MALCWCTTNDKEKTEAIKVAEQRIEALSATVESGTARAGEVATMISGLPKKGSLAIHPTKGHHRGGEAGQYDYLIGPYSISSY